MRRGRYNFRIVHNIEAVSLVQFQRQQLLQDI